jgi:hypothetical protein
MSQSKWDYKYPSFHQEDSFLPKRDQFLSHNAYVSYYEELFSLRAGTYGTNETHHRAGVSKTVWKVASSYSYLTNKRNHRFGNSGEDT